VYNPAVDGDLAPADPEVYDGEKQMGGSGGSLEPPGPLLTNPLGLFSRTSITTSFK
jgi:hypothetical protein